MTRRKYYTVYSAKIGREFENAEGEVGICLQETWKDWFFERATAALNKTLHRDTECTVGQERMKRLNDHKDLLRKVYEERLRIERGVKMSEEKQTEE